MQLYRINKYNNIKLIKSNDKRLVINNNIEPVKNNNIKLKKNKTRPKYATIQSLEKVKQGQKKDDIGLVNAKIRS